MRKPVKLRALTSEETTEIRRLAASCNGPFRIVQRAGLFAVIIDDPNLYASEAGQRVGFRSLIMGVVRIRRFNIEDCPACRIRGALSVDQSRVKDTVP